MRYILAFVFVLVLGTAQASEGVLRATLPNGLRVVVVPIRLAPVVATALTYLAGSNDSPPGFPGTAHALEHMMFRGSQGLSKDQLFELSARLGGSYNASTAETITQYTYTVPREDLGVVLRTEALRMRGLDVTQADWEQERGAIQQEVSRNQSSPFYRFYAQAQAILFAGTPYETDALGTKSSFERTDAALLRAYYDRWYAPNNAVLVIAGDVDPAQALGDAETAFGPIPRRPVPEHAPTVLQPLEPRSLALSSNLATGVVALAYRMPGLNSPDFAAADILSDVINSQRGALFGLVPAGRALSAQFSYGAKAGVGMGLAFGAFPVGGDPAPLMADLRRVIEDAARNGVPPELVEASKRQEIAQLAFESDSIAGLARVWSRALIVQGLEAPEDAARAYAAVTVEDVNRLARLLIEPAITAVLTPERSGAAVASASGLGAEVLGTPPDGPVVLPAWAADALATLRVPPAPDAPDVSTLPNGIRLIVQPHRVSPTVSVYGRIRNVAAVQEPAGQEGVAALMDQMFAYGTEAKDRIAFRTALDDIAAGLDPGVDFSLRVLAPQFEPGMRLLAENQLRPAFPPAAFEVVRRQLAQNLAGQLQSPAYRYGRAINDATVPAGDPTTRQATAQSVSAVSLDDVRAYYAATFRPDLTTIVVLGDVTPVEARRVVMETFGGWQASGPAPSIDLPPIGPNPPGRSRVPDPGAIQDSVALTQAVPLPGTHPDRYALQLGNTILGEGFASRLYQELRVKSGYVYSVRSGLDTSRTRSRFDVSFGADPANVEAARALVVRELRAMQTTPVSDAELSRAKSQVLRRLPLQLSSVGGVASLFLRQTELGLPLDSQQVAAQRYLDMTAAEIQQAFATWVQPDRLVQVVRGPAAP